MKARKRRGEDDGSVVEEKEMFLNPFAKFCQSGHELRGVSILSSSSLNFFLTGFEAGCFHNLPRLAAGGVNWEIRVADDIGCNFEGHINSTAGCAGNRADDDA